MSKFMVPVGMLVCAVILSIAGFSGSNQEAFLFPNVVSVIMVIIAGFAVYNSRNTLQKEKSIRIPWPLILPAIAIFIIYLALAETVGFYTCSFIAFVTLVSIYMPGSITLNRFVRIFITGLIFMGGLYCLFSLLLKVQLPRGFLF